MFLCYHVTYIYPCTQSKADTNWNIIGFAGTVFGHNPKYETNWKFDMMIMLDKIRLYQISWESFQ